MSAHAAPASGGLTLSVRGTTYPVVLPKLSDPRLHLAATITSLQVIGQVGFHFQLSIAQILISLATCAVLEVAIAVRRQHVLLWPASALLTGNGVAFVLRVPGTVHGDWWSVRGWWIFAGTAAVALLSKYVLVWRGSHIFNPSNIGLVICFLALGRTRAAPLDFWWGPMSRVARARARRDRRRRLRDPAAARSSCALRSASGSRSRPASPSSRLPDTR